MQALSGRKFEKRLKARANPVRIVRNDDGIAFHARRTHLRRNHGSVLAKKRQDGTNPHLPCWNRIRQHLT